MYRIYLVRTLHITTLVVLSQTISGGQNINDLNLYLYSKVMFSKSIYKPEAS